MRHGSQARFGSIWYDPPLPEQYAKIDAVRNGYAMRAASIQSIYPNLTGPVLVAGSPFGYQVAALRALGYEAFGIDEYDGSADYHPDAAAFMFIANAAGSNASLRPVRDAAGLRGNAKFALVVTDDILACADDDAEAVQFASVAADKGESVVHLISAGEAPTDGDLHDMLWHTPSEWRALVPASHPIIDFDTGEVY